MKTPSVFLALSVAANLALLVWLLGPKLVNQNKETGQSQKPSSPADHPVDAARLTSSAAPVSPPVWQRLDADGDLAGVVTRLRAAGFPPRLVRAIMTSLVAEQFDAERYKIDEVALHTPYWKPWPNSYQDPKVGPALRKLQRDQQGIIKQLLGEPGPDEASEESRAWQQLSMGNLPPEKIDRLNAYLAGHNEKQAQIFGAITKGGALLDGDRTKLAALDKALRADLAEFLTPDEANEYILRNATAAHQLKWMLNPFQATEGEFRTILPLYQTYTDTYPAASSGQPPDVSVDPAQQAAKDALIAQLASTLGQQRADDLRIALDPKYAGLSRLVSRLDLPLKAAKQVFDVQQDIQQRVAAVRDNAALGVTERADHLHALAQEASTKISAALGGTPGLDVYKNNGGQWLLSLTPPET